MCKFSDDDVYECPENTVIFLISNIEYLTTAFVFAISKPFLLFLNLLKKVFILIFL